METNSLLDNEIPKYSDYAGFWLRLVASLVDGVVLVVAGLLILKPILLLFGINYPSFESHSRELIEFLKENPNASFTEILETALGMSINDYIIIVITSGIMRWLYFAIMESSSKQATLGKMSLRLQVTDMDGNRITFLRATGRHFGKIISALIFLVGFIMAGFTEKKQALHDMMAGCLVYRK